MSDDEINTVDNNVKPLTFKYDYFNFNSTIMEVVEVVDGEARIVYNEDNNTQIQVYSHTYSVPYLKCGDIVMLVATEYGLVVSDKLRPTFYGGIKGDNVVKINSMLYHQPECDRFNSHIMLVNEVDNGIATSLINKLDNKYFPVFGQTCNVPVVTVGYEVLVTKFGDNIMICDLIRAKGHKPFKNNLQYKDGMLEIELGKEYKFKLDGISIRISSDGRIKVNDKLVKAADNGKIIINGQHYNLFRKDE